MEAFIEKIGGLLESVAPQPFLNIGGIQLTTVVRNTWIIMILLIVFTFVSTRNLKKIPTSKIQILAEKIVEMFQSLTKSVCGEYGKQMYGIVGSIFLVILFMNFIWLIPTLSSPTASYSTTSAMAIFGFGYAQFTIIRNRGGIQYIKNYFKPMPVMAIFNVTSFFTSPLSMSVRLFGSVFTGEVLVALMYLVFGLLVPIPFYALGILTGVVQAYVFSILICIFASEGLGE